MDSPFSAKLKRLRRNLSLRGVFLLLALGVILPALASTSVGIVALVIGEGDDDLVIGVLVVSFTAVAIGASVAATILLGVRARTARLQADLLANVSHELRTPLAVIRMYAQTLQHKRFERPEQEEACVETIIRETERLEAMIQRVLTWRAAAKDRDVAAIERAPLSPTVAQAIARFQRMLAPGEVELDVELDAEVQARHDPHQITESVLNLLVNAHKYTRSPRRVRVRTLLQGEMAAIVVEDNGVGIPHAEIKRIFDPFYRVQRTNHKAAGAGLGLAIVRHIAKVHGGQILVESEVGVGSAFTLQIPGAAP
ncbi:HAMP domain-containing histidine kinase [Myxococcota bacterium]|nr:HAMP domain-containing histidine kinase [Myxococcota bacterium]